MSPLGTLNLLNYKMGAVLVIQPSTCDTVKAPGGGEIRTHSGHS